MDQDFVLCECPLGALEEFVSSIENDFKVKVAKAPSICMTMIQAEDSVELQPFYLGEALTTECQVIVNGQVGYGLCLGDEPVRSYCIAVFDAVMQLEDVDLLIFRQFLQEQAAWIDTARKTEYAQVLRTKVDFKIMEQE